MTEYDIDTCPYCHFHGKHEKQYSNGVWVLDLCQKCGQVF